MGIQGLLPLLKEIQVPRHISDFKGQTLAIDAYVWLHRAAFSCAPLLVKSPSQLDPSRFVDYSLHRIRLLRYHGIEAYVVFDGGPLRAKGGTEVGRARRREDHLLKALAYEAQGRHKDARDCYTKCVDITPEMAGQLIKALKAENVPYVVAPYEADAQLAYLEREGIVDGIITEDSDLLVFGCKSVIYRLDSNGDCMSISRDRFPLCREFSFVGWTDTEFRRMAIMAGCDYLDSIPGIGLKTAHRLLRKHKTVEKVVQNVKLDGTCIVPADYIPQFRLAELVFLHQRVYDPRSRCLVTLLPLPARGLDEIECGYIGPDMSPAIAQGLAEGRLHPETKEPLDDPWPEYRPQAKGTVSVPTAQPEVKHEGFYKVKTPLGQSQKQNTSGPLDSFFKRGSPSASATKPKDLVSKPFIPAPVGTRTSGPARLSDLTSGSVNAEAGPSRLRSVDFANLPGEGKGDLKVSKFFSVPSSRKTPTTKEKDGLLDSLKIEYSDHVLLPEPVLSLPGQAVHVDHDAEMPFSDDALPSPICSSVASPRTSVRHGSPMTSPGRSGDEGDGEHKRRQSRSPSPTESLQSPSRGRQRKRQRHGPTVDTPDLECNILAPSSETVDQPRTPELAGHDLSAFCGPRADDDCSLYGGHAMDEVEAIEEDNVSSDENERLLAAAKNAATVAKGWRTRYAFTANTKPFSPAQHPQVTPRARTPLVARTDSNTPSARPDMTHRSIPRLRMDAKSAKKDPRNKAVIHIGKENTMSSPLVSEGSSRALLPMSAAMDGPGMSMSGAGSGGVTQKSVLVHASPEAPAARGSGGSKLQRFRFVPQSVT